MDWTEILQQIVEPVVCVLISAVSFYLIRFISAKIQELKTKTENETTKKYLDILDEAVANAVLATTQTYVDSLKSEGMFNEEAHKVAFVKTYDAVMQVLTTEAVECISTVVGDIDTYVTAKIESYVKLSKVS
jgi:hypothetical protein